MNHPTCKATAPGAGLVAEFTPYGGFVKLSFAVVLVFMLGACASSPPLPPECEGELVPINAVKTTTDKAGRDEARRGS